MRILLRLACLLFACALVAPQPAHSLEKIIAGTVGAPSGGQWPFMIAATKGYFAAEGIELDTVYVPTAPGLIQQLAAGSIEIVVTSGLVEPILAAQTGAPMAILRIIGQSPPYALLAKPSIASIKDLKGKTISLGGLTDITRVYFDRMMAGNGLKEGDYDIVIAGATGARLAALASGGVDCTILLPPVSFQAEALGFRNIGMAFDYVQDLPFTGSMVNTVWAQRHGDAVKAYLRAVNRAVAWYYDPANREEAIDIMADSVKVGRNEAVMTFDFFRKIELFEPTGKVSRARIEKLIEVQRQLGLLKEPLAVERVVLAGVTELTD